MKAGIEVVRHNATENLCTCRQLILRCFAVGGVGGKAQQKSETVILRNNQGARARRIRVQTLLLFSLCNILESTKPVPYY
jgi:hypothetical protein